MAPKTKADFSFTPGFSRVIAETNEPGKPFQRFLWGLIMPEKETPHQCPSTLIKGRFAWGRGYGAFSVSHSDVGRVAAYIVRQEKHHHKNTFREEFQLFVTRYGLEWHDD